MSSPNLVDNVNEETIDNLTVEMLTIENSKLKKEIEIIRQYLNTLLEAIREM
jgi:hypothetical protein